MEFKQAVITDYGRELMAKLLNGKQTKFTKLRISSTTYSDAQLTSLTALTNIKRETTVNVYEKNQATILAIGKINNDGVAVGFDINTVGLYAEDPDRGEILYSVSSASVKGYVPASNGGKSSTAIELRIYTEVSNATNVTMNVEPSDPITNYDLERFKENYYDKVETNELLARIFAGEEITLTFSTDFKGKVAGNTDVNPHKAFRTPGGVYSNISNLLGPDSGIWLELENARYAEVAEIGGGITSISRDQGISQALAQWNLVEVVERRIPGIFSMLGSTSLQGSAVLLRKMIVNESANVWGFGSSPTGNKLNFSIWNAEAKQWQGTISHTNSSVTRLNRKTSGISPFLSNDGNICVLAYGEPSDGVTSCTVAVDYFNFEFELKLKLSEFLKPKKVWAWSLDGTDRFTTMYPKENIYVGSFPMMCLWEPNSQKVRVDSAVTSDGWCRIPLTRQNVYYWTEVLPYPTQHKAFKTGDVITQSMRIRTDAKVDLSKKVVFNWFTVANGFKNVTGRIEKVKSNEYIISSTLEITASMNDVGVRLFDLADSTQGIEYYNSGSYLDFKDFKVEYNKGRTIYTTAPSVDLLNSFPHFVGSAAVASDDPNDYDWRHSAEYIDYIISKQATIEQINNLADRVSALEP